jgi:hypothetical protein
LNLQFLGVVDTTCIERQQWIHQIEIDVRGIIADQTVNWFLFRVRVKISR